MFFKKLHGARPSEERSSSSSADTTAATTLSAIPGGASAIAKGRPTPIRTAALGASAGADDVGLGMVLDALGSVLATLSRYPLELPDRPGEEVARDMSAWQRHATLGYPVHEREAGGGAVGVRERDWDGLARAVSMLRREEHRHVTGSISELRDALWACVETVHKAVQVDQETDLSTESQVRRARSAVHRLQTGSIKTEVLGAMSAIEEALTTRRTRQEEQYVSLATKLDRLGRQLEEARRESTTDPLTGLGNRKLFDTMGPRAVQMFSLSRQPVVLLMIDLDKLKMINDLYGHQAGDGAIAGLANALGKVFLRQSDTLCRIGGDEFAAILPNTDWRMAQTLAKRLQEQIAALPSLHPAMEFQVGASVGVAQLEPFEELDEWVARADKALYRAKGNGRERVCVAESVLPQTAQA